MPGDDIESRGNKRSRTAATSANRSDEIEPANWVSWLIPLFVVANFVVFFVEMYFNDCPKHSGTCVARFLHRFSFQPLRENPLFGPSDSTLEKLGALSWSQHQGWRLISCIWLHAGVVHLLANMLSLAITGIRLEQQFGFVRIGIIYLLSGFGGSMISYLLIRNDVNVGASGALFGIIGAVLSDLITNWSIYSKKVWALVLLLVIVLVNLGIGVLPHLDNAAHAGGFFTGLLLGFILLPLPQFGWIERNSLSSGVRVQSKYKPYQSVLRVVSLVVLLIGFTVLLVLLFRVVNRREYCKWCGQLNCITGSELECPVT